MTVIKCESYEEMSSVAADLVVGQIESKPDSVLGLATGSTPLGLYAELIKRYEDKHVDFSQIVTFNLDEYYPIAKDHPQSYHYYMDTNFFSKVNIASKYLPDGQSDDPDAQSALYDAQIEAAGGIDLQILGIGTNGHIGFNEPSDAYSMSTFMTALAPSTIESNSRYFAAGETQPTSAITMGIGGIFNAKKIVLLISGASKAPVAKRLLENKVYTDLPASLLLLHRDFTVILDREALGE